MSMNEDLVEFLRSELFTFRTNVKEGFADLSRRVDQTNVRLDASINMTRDFRKDVSDRLDHIGGYLQTINGNILNHETRIAGLEQRVDHLEQTG